jgi:Prenylcysteine lyase
MVISTMEECRENPVVSSSVARDRGLRNVDGFLSVYNKPVELIRPSSAASFGERVKEWFGFGKSVNGAKGIGSQYRRQLRRLRELGIQDSVNAIVDLLGLNQPRSQTGAAIFAHHGVSKTYINRIIKSESLVQFGQEASSMNLLTLGMMAYAADEGKSQKGGSLVSVLESMLSRSRNIHLHLNTEVFGLRKLNATKWVLASRDSRTLEDEAFYLFDGVILAAPMTSLQLDIRGANLTTPDEFVKYLPRYVTWFTASTPLNSGQVGKNGVGYPNRIITRIPPSWKTPEHQTGAIEILNMGIHVRHSPFGQTQERMYRVVSDMHVTDENIRDLLGGRYSSWIARHNVRFILEYFAGNI